VVCARKHDVQVAYTKSTKHATTAIETANLPQMAPRTKKRRASDVIILSSPPKKFLVPIYISISSEDEGNPPAKKQTPSPGVRVKENGTTPNPGKGNEKFGVSVSTSRGLTISINDSDSDNEVLAATGQYELLRSWVDAGIEIAMREMAGEDWQVWIGLKWSIANSSPVNRHIP